MGLKLWSRAADTRSQAAATVTTHHVHLFSCELTPEEMEFARKCAAEKKVFGNEDESERTYIETVTLREAIPAAKMDFTTLGMIMQVHSSDGASSRDVYSLRTCFNGVF